MIGFGTDFVFRVVHVAINAMVSPNDFGVVLNHVISVSRCHTLSKSAKRSGSDQPDLPARSSPGSPAVGTGKRGSGAKQKARALCALEP